MTIDLEKIREHLEAKGLSAETREKIRSSKICIIDDKIEDLQGMTSALRREGYNNLIELEEVPSINELLNRNYDLIILDLGGVAESLSKDDGYGVLQNLKISDPYLPVLVVTGSTTPPEKVNIINQADLIRSKPVLPADLSYDVELILIHKKNEFWAGLELLSALNQIKDEINKNISLVSKIILHFHKKSIAKKILNDENDIVSTIFKVANITSKLGKISLKINKIATGIG